MVFTIETGERGHGATIQIGSNWGCITLRRQFTDEGLDPTWKEPSYT